MRISRCFSDTWLCSLLLLVATGLPLAGRAQTLAQQCQAASQLLAQNKTAEGMAKLSALIQAHPTYAEAKAVRGFAYYYQGEARKALADLDAAQAALPTRDDLPFKRSLVLAELQGDYTAALQAVSQAIRLKPEGTYYCYRGQYLLEKGLADRALADEEKAIELRANYDEAYLHKGHALFTLQRYPEALTAYEKAFALNADLPDALLSQGVVLEKHLNQPDRALAIYRKAQKLFVPLARPFTQEAEYWLARQDWTQARTAAQQATEAAPRNAKAHNLLALSSYKLKDYPTAEAGFRRAWQLSPYDASICSNLCSVLVDQKRYTEQLQAAEQGLANVPESPELHLQKAVALKFLNRQAESDQAWTKAKELAQAQGRGNELK